MDLEGVCKVLRRVEAKIDALRFTAELPVEADDALVELGREVNLIWQYFGVDE